MAIDTSGKWWVASEADDIREYLVAYEAEGYPIDTARICRCTCGAETFKFEADRDEGVARRTCTACGAKHMICDSDEYWEEAKPEGWKCTECGCDICNLGVAFSLYATEVEAPQDIRWLSIGNRCTKCGTLGSFVDWKVGYGGSGHLVDAV